MKKIDNKYSGISKLDLVLGFLAVKDYNSITEKVRILDSLGYNNKEMALICNSTEGTVAVQKTLSKKNKKKK